MSKPQIPRGFSSVGAWSLNIEGHVRRGNLWDCSFVQRTVRKKEILNLLIIIMSHLNIESKGPNLCCLSWLELILAVLRLSPRRRRKVHVSNIIVVSLCWVGYLATGLFITETVTQSNRIILWIAPVLYRKIGLFYIFSLYNPKTCFYQGSVILYSYCYGWRLFLRKCYQKYQRICWTARRWQAVMNGKMNSSQIAGNRGERKEDFI